MKYHSYKSITRLAFFAMSVTSITASCKTVKAYQKNKLNDSEMGLANRKIEKTELNSQTYREAASGANAGKTGGGCGCN